MSNDALVGTWHETAWLECGTCIDLDPGQKALQELRFASDGSYELAWMPFEAYYDYWGDYTLQGDIGLLMMTVTGGNMLPTQYDGVGRVAFVGADEIVLWDAWLGVSPVDPRPCGHRFVRDY